MCIKTSNKRTLSFKHFFLQCIFDIEVFQFFIIHVIKFKVCSFCIQMFNTYTLKLQIFLTLGLF